MLGRPSLRRRLILSYLLVVMAVTAAAFVTVQILVPQFFEQGVQQRLGPGSSDSDGTTPGNPNAPGRNSSPSTSTTGGSSNLPPSTTSNPPPTSGPTPTGSTMAPGGPGDDPGSGR